MNGKLNFKHYYKSQILLEKKNQGNKNFIYMAKLFNNLWANFAGGKKYFLLQQVTYHKKKKKVQLSAYYYGVTL